MWGLRSPVLRLPCQTPRSDATCAPAKGAIGTSCTEGLKTEALRRGQVRAPQSTERPDRRALSGEAAADEPRACAAPVVRVLTDAVRARDGSPRAAPTRQRGRDGPAGRSGPDVARRRG